MGVYPLIGLLLFAIGGIWIAIVGLPLLVLFQYLVTASFHGLFTDVFCKFLREVQAAA
jgi:uncharacterized membrane protein YeiH